MSVLCQDHPQSTLLAVWTRAPRRCLERRVRGQSSRVVMKPSARETWQDQSLGRTRQATKVRLSSDIYMQTKRNMLRKDAGKVHTCVCFERPYKAYRQGLMPRAGSVCVCVSRQPSSPRPARIQKCVCVCVCVCVVRPGAVLDAAQDAPRGASASRGEGSGVGAGSGGSPPQPSPQTTTAPRPDSPITHTGEEPILHYLTPYDKQVA